MQPFVDFLRAAEASIFKSSEVLKTAGISQRSSSLLFLVFQRHVPSTSQNTAEVPPEKVIANVVPFQKAGSPSSSALKTWEIHLRVTQSKHGGGTTSSSLTISLHS